MLATRNEINAELSDALAGEWVKLGFVSGVAPTDVEKLELLRSIFIEPPPPPPEEYVPPNPPCSGALAHFASSTPH